MTSWPFGKHKAPIAFPAAPISADSPPRPRPTTTALPGPQVAPTKPVSAVPRLFIGAWSFCGFEAEREEHGKVPGSQCPWRFPWEKIEPPFDRKMGITSPGMREGAYDQRDPAVMDWTLANMERIPLTDIAHQFEVSWAHMGLPGTTRPSWAEEYPGAPYMMEHFIKHHASANTKIKLSASFWQRIISADDRENYWNDLKENCGWSAHTMKAGWQRLARDVAEWMKSPNWHEVDGKLVFTLGYAHTLPMYAETFPSTEVDLSPAGIVKILRDEVRAVTGKELYLIATATPPNFIDPSNESIESPDERMNLREAGFDAFGPYLLHGSSWGNAMSVYQYWRERDLRAARRAGLDYWPAITAGYNGRAWQTQEWKLGFTHMPTPAELAEHVRETIAWSRANGLRGLKIYALGEGGEGGEVNVCSGDADNWVVGDEHLKAVALGLRQAVA
jgi:hypothetical protein